MGCGLHVLVSDSTAISTALADDMSICLIKTCPKARGHQLEGSLAKRVDMSPNVHLVRLLCWS